MAELDFARIFEALPSPFMVLDNQLRYVAANAEYLKAVDRTLPALIGRKVMDLFPAPGESGQRLQASLEEVLATGKPDTLAYLPYPIAREDGSVYNGYWTAIHVPILDARGKVEFILQNTVDVTELARMREAASLPFSSLSAATRLIERTREAEAASADFRRLFQQAPAFFAVMSGPAHIFTFASDSYVRLVGGRNVVGLPLEQALPEVVEQGFIEILDRVYREGFVHAAEGARVMLDNSPGKPPEERFVDFSYNPIRDGSGAITGVFVQGMDRTESFRAARRQRLLIDELNHRVKNTLATVQSIAAQTLRRTADIATAREAFEARIMALSKAHTVLSERQWHDTELELLVRQELGAFNSEQVRLAGPVLAINSKATVALALALHELATNAAKHGALSVAGGTVDVSWREGEAESLELAWRERGGPGASEPSRRGFGSRLLNTVVSGELGGQLDLRYEPQGLQATLVIPRAAYAAQETMLV